MLFACLALAVLRSTILPITALPDSIGYAGARCQELFVGFGAPCEM